QRAGPVAEGQPAGLDHAGSVANRSITVPASTPATTVMPSAWARTSTGTRSPPWTRTATVPSGSRCKAASGTTIPAVAGTTSTDNVTCVAAVIPSLAAQSGSHTDKPSAPDTGRTVRPSSRSIGLPSTPVSTR